LFKKRKREEQEEIETKGITEEMITEVRKVIGSEKKVSIDWVKKITLLTREILEEIVIEKLGMKIEEEKIIQE